MKRLWSPLTLTNNDHPNHYPCNLIFSLPISLSHQLSFPLSIQFKKSQREDFMGSELKSTGLWGHLCLWQVVGGGEGGGEGERVLEGIEGRVKIRLWSVTRISMKKAKGIVAKWKCKWADVWKKPRLFFVVDDTELYLLIRAHFLFSLYLLNQFAQHFVTLCTCNQALDQVRICSYKPA